MRLLILGILLSLCTFQACNWILQPDMIGWISFDPTIDDSAFQLCDEEKARRGQVNYPGYKEGKRDLKAYFMQNVEKFEAQAGEHGHIVIRFLINCNGTTGRFRVEQIGRDYKPRKFAAHIPQKLLESIQKIDEWLLPEGKDGYGFVTFKIENGQLIDVM